MKLRELMQGPVRTAAPADDAEGAFRRMQSEGVRHLVVVSDGAVVGILSDRDMGGQRGHSVRLGQAVGELMSGDPVIGHPDLDLRDAAALFTGCAIGCLPVVENEQLIGIVTRSDLLELLARSPTVE